MTNEVLNGLEPFDPERLDELTRRANSMAFRTDAELAEHLLLAHQIYAYYISETTDYLEAAVNEASKRLARNSSKA